MVWTEKIKQILNQPKQDEINFRKRLKYAVYSGLFVFMFLVFFQPFGLSDYIRQGASAIFFMAGYGVVTFVVLILNLIFFPKLFPKIFISEKWKVWCEIVYYVWFIFLIGTANMIYTALISPNNLSFRTFLNFQLYTLPIGIIIITTVVLIEQNAHLKNNLKSALEMNANLHKDRIQNSHIPSQNSIIVKGQNSNDELTLVPADLYFIKSIDNYVEVCSRDQKGIKRNILRSTLKRLEDDFTEFPNLYKCHRAYLVNIHNIDHITGNSQGYRLHFSDIEEAIPVSRNCSKEFRNMLT